MIPLEKPYVNLFVHKSCYESVDIRAYIYKNIEKILKYIEELNEKR